MSQKRETECEWTRRICEYLQDQLACVVKTEFAASRYQQPGWPDRYISHTVWQGWLEFKGESTLVSTIQRRRMQALWIRDPGCVYIVRRGPWIQGSGYQPNLLQHYHDEVCIGKWNKPEELLLLLSMQKGMLYELLENEIAANYESAMDALVKRLEG